MQSRRRIPTDNVKLLTVEDACARYSLGMNSMRNLAKEYGAIVRIGRNVRVNVVRMDAVIDAMIEGANEAKGGEGKQ